VSCIVQREISKRYSASRIYRVDLEMQSLDFSPCAAFVRKVLYESN
jgi:hypothetical protein